MYEDHVNVFQLPVQVVQRSTKRFWFPLATPIMIVSGWRWQLFSGGKSSDRILTFTWSTSNWSRSTVDPGGAASWRRRARRICIPQVTRNTTVNPATGVLHLWTANITALNFIKEIMTIYLQNTDIVLRLVHLSYQIIWSNNWQMKYSWRTLHNIVVHVRLILYKK